MSQFFLIHKINTPFVIYLTSCSAISRLTEDIPLPHCKLITNHDMKYRIIIAIIFYPFTSKTIIAKCSRPLYIAGNIMAGKVKELAFNHNVFLLIFFYRWSGIFLWESTFSSAVTHLVHWGQLALLKLHQTLIELFMDSRQFGLDLDLKMDIHKSTEAVKKFLFFSQRIF